MEIIAFEEKTQEATAAILLNNVIAVLNNKRSSKEDFEFAVKPFTVIQWTRSMLEKLGIDRVNRVLGRLKRTKTDKAMLRIIIDHFKIALSDQSFQMPAIFAEWHTVLLKYSLNQIADWSTWATVINFLNSLKITSPPAMAELTLEGIHIYNKTSPFQELTLSLWQAVRIEFAQAKGVLPLTIQFRSPDFSLSDALRAQNVETSAFGKRTGCGYEGTSATG